MSNGHERFKKMVEASQDWFWEFDENANFTYVSPSIRDLLGYEPEELIGLNAFDLMAPDEAERVHNHFDPIAKKYLPFSNLVNINTHKDGNEVVIESSGTPIFDEAGQFLGYRGIDRDITQRMEVKDALRESKEKLQNILDNTSEWIWEIDLSGNHIYSNHRLLKLLGYPPEEFLGKEYANFLHPDDFLDVQEALPRLISARQGWNGWVLRWRHRDGSYRYLESNAKPIFDAAGEVVGYRGADRDITGRKKAEEALQKSEMLFRDFFESNPVATIITSPSGAIHMINTAFSKGSGYSAEEVIGHTTQELGFWNDPATRELMVAAIKEHGFIDNLETILCRKGGLPMTGLVCSRAIEYKDEVRVLSTVVDVTAQREAEKALRNLDQAKSDFIATAAHELRTPLVAILGYAELLESAAQLRISAQEQQSYSSIIRSNAEILARLTDDLLDVEQIQLDSPFRLTREKTSLSKLIKVALASFALKCPDHQFILTHADLLPETMWIDSIRINQVLSNLLDNAVKYSPEGRIVEVSTETDENQVNISIKDHGVGMTNEEVEQIFHRFYRAKSMSTMTQGLGLGLCIVKRIVEDHGGEMSVASLPGEGTTVTFTLPIKRTVDTEARE